VSPLRGDGYTEYRDADFLRALGLGHLVSKLLGFWPLGGPCWDALARIESSQSNAFLLVEAKSHVSEIYGNCCGAAGKSLKQIESALNRTKVWLGVDPAADWTSRLYQSANRYAHLYFLREIAGVEAYLANVYFVDDPHSPTGVEEWQMGIRLVEQELKVVAPVPFTAAVFLPIVD
jgi:hypothetical protein